MNHLSPTASIIVLLVNAAFLIGIGICARRKQVDTAEDYMVAGRRVKWPLISGSIVVTWAWASTILAAGEAAYTYGWPAVWIYPISGLSLFLVAPFFKKIRQCMPHGTTFTEFVKVRFGDQVHKLLVFVALFVHIILLMYLGTGLGAGIAPIFGITYMQAVVFSCIVIIIFTVLGGLWSSILTDYFQYSIMWIVLAIVAVFAFVYIGPGELFDTLQSQGQETGFALYTSRSFGDLFMVYLVGWITYAAADQTMWQRAYAIEKPKDTAKCFLFAWGAWSLLPMLAGILGVVAMGLGITTSNGSDILANLIVTIAPKWVMIAWSFLVFNAIASSYGSVLVALSSIVTTDIYKSYIRKDKELSQKKMLNLTTLLVLVFGVIGMIISLKPGSIMNIGIYLSGFLIISGLPIFASYFMERLNRKCVFTGVLVAFILALVFSTAVNFGWITHIGSWNIQIWQVYVLILVSEAAISMGGSALFPGERVTFEELDAMQTKIYEKQTVVD